MGLAQYKNHKDKLQYPYNTQEWKERVDCAYDLQQETQSYILNLIKKYTEETGIKNVVISGGYGLNWSYNGNCPVSKKCYVYYCSGGWTKCDKCYGKGK